MEIEEIKKFLGNDWDSVTDTMKASLDTNLSLLNDVNNSILSSSGKQLRPVLALLAARACNDGKVTEATYRYASAVELLHNATLLHDDVADNSDCRRGRPTIRSLMGPSVSVLVGDFWLVRTIDLVLGESESSYRVVRLLSRTLSDLAEGEMLQLQKAGEADTEEEDYYRIITNKTASLFEVAMLSAAISVDAPVAYEKAVSDYAVALGLAFQVKDDILDYAGTESVGKPLGVDIRERKITLPLLGALAGVRKERQAEIRDMIKRIDEHDSTSEIIAFVKENGGIEYACAELDRLIGKAVASLDILPDTREKQLLVELAHFTADRIK